MWETCRVVEAHLLLGGVEVVDLEGQLAVGGSECCQLLLAERRRPLRAGHAATGAAATRPAPVVHHLTSFIQGVQQFDWSCDLSVCKPFTFSSWMADPAGVSPRLTQELPVHRVCGDQGCLNAVSLSRLRTTRPVKQPLWYCKAVCDKPVAHLGGCSRREPPFLSADDGTLPARSAPPPPLLLLPACVAAKRGFVTTKTLATQ